MHFKMRSLEARSIVHQRKSMDTGEGICRVCEYGKTQMMMLECWLLVISDPNFCLDASLNASMLRGMPWNQKKSF